MQTTVVDYNQRQTTMVDKGGVPMNIPKIPEGEYRFCLIMWEHEPVSSLELVKLCQEKLAWKRTTTYTVIKRLGERGVLKLENGIVTSLISKEEVEKAVNERLKEPSRKQINGNAVNTAKELPTIF